MTTKNLGAVIAAIGIAALIASMAYAKSEDAPLAEVQAAVVNEPSVVRPEVTRKPLVKKPEWTCKNRLATVLYKAGFRGENLHEAWAIAMRESNGIPTQVSHGSDFGLFQFNYPSHHADSWWNSDALLKASYNARIAFKISDGGRDWSQWGLDGHGNTQAYLYRNYGWTQWEIDNWITIPYQKYYKKYPCK